MLRVPGPALLRARGAAAVETAIIMPLLLFVVFGLVDFGRMLNAQLQLTEAAREGARASVLHQSPGSRVDQVVTLNGGATTSVVSACPPAYSAVPDTAIADIQVQYAFQFITPVAALATLM